MSIQKTVLVVDNGDMRKALSEILAEFDYQVVEACNGREASVLMSKDGCPVDIIVTDFKMPVLNGIGLIRQLRAANNYVPVLLLTDHLELIDRNAPEMARVGLLKKPFIAAELREAISALARPECKLEPA